MRSVSMPPSQVDKIPVLQNMADIRTSKSVFGDFTCVLRGYHSILTLREMQDKAAQTHQVDVGRERKIACGLMIVSAILIGALVGMYYFLIFNLNYDLQAGVIIIMEIFCVVSFLIMGMCLFRWCSLRDVSPYSIWHRVAKTQCSPLKLIKFDMEDVNVTYFEYTVDYGTYPHELHEPIVTLVRKHKVCNARDLVKITKKDPDHDKEQENKDIFSKYGAIYFHFKGDDNYLLDRWKYEFGKYNASLLHVYKQCMCFNHVFHTHFDNRFRVGHDGHAVKSYESKYINYATTTKEKEDNIISILDAFGPTDDDEDYFHNESSISYSSDPILHAIHPKLLRKSHTIRNHNYNHNQRKGKKYNSVKPH